MVVMVQGVIGCRLPWEEGVIWGEATLHHQGNSEGGSRLPALPAAAGVSPLVLKRHLGCSAQHLQWSTFCATQTHFFLEVLEAASSRILVVSFPGRHFQEEMRQTPAGLRATSMLISPSLLPTPSASPSTGLNSFPGGVTQIDPHP